jgi:hypothetical protein
MEYFNKYLKYKNKYLELKQQQIGGEAPLISTIRNIQLIKDKCINYYLDPIYGFIFSNNGFIFNYYNFYDSEDKLNLIGKIINKIFDRNLTLTGDIKKEDSITPKFIGNVISYLYLLKFHNLENKLKIDKLNRFNRVQIYCKQKLIDIIENIIKTSSKKFREIINIIKKCDHVDAFRILLIIMWRKAKNKDGIKKYYEGINEIFMYYNELVTKKIEIINIPNDFLEDKRGTDFQEELILINSDFHIYGQESPINICNVNFPDCGEQTIRNFINMICINNNFFDINILKKLNASCKLIEYYTVFNNFSKQSNGDFKVFGKTFTGRTAWNFMVSNLQNVRYNNIPQSCVYDGKPFLYNIEGGLNLTNNMPNLFQVIINLFEGINTFDELIGKLKTNRLIYSVTDYKYIYKNGTGKITFDIKKWNFTMILQTGHYKVELITKPIQSKNYLSYNEKNIIRTLSNFYLIPDKIDSNFMYNKWTKENIISIINYINIDKNLYNNIFQYINKLGFDEKKRINLNFNLIRNILNYDLTDFGVGYTCTDNEKIITSLFYSTDYPLSSELLNKINTLEKLNLGYYFNKPLGNSLSSLTKLKELIFSEVFNKNINCSLKTLTNLQKLTFGTDFNNGDTPLTDALSSLINLESLIFDEEFINGNESLNNSLSSLTKLKKLIFGFKFNNGNKPIDNTFSTLTSLEELTFGGDFNNGGRPLDNSLNNLTSLQKLTFESFTTNVYRYYDQTDGLGEDPPPEHYGRNFDNGNQPILDSLSNLTNLKQLIFSSRFDNGDTPLGNSLSTLTSLELLNLGNYKQSLGNSLNSLTNLKELTLGYNFNNGDTPLDISLSTLTSLEKLSLGYKYSQPLNNSLKTLTNLQSLSGNFIHENITDNLPNPQVKVINIPFNIFLL